jgi:AraC family transcriptional regulator
MGSDCPNLYSDMSAITLSLEERLERLVQGFARSESRRRIGDELSHSMAYSPAQALRLFRRRFTESPARFRKRLMLERAAESLRQSDLPVWKVALECGYASPEPFIRSFQRAFRVSPGRYRAMSAAHTWLPAENSLHYWRGAIVSSESKGDKKMNLSNRMIEHDLWLTRRILEVAQNLSDEQLDEAMSQPVQLVFFEEPDRTLRDMIDNLVFTKEVWLKAIYNRPFDIDRDKSTAGLMARWKVAEPEFRSLAANLEAENRWDDLFVDGLCTPPATFSFGGVFAHILTHAAARRAVILAELRRIGRDELGFGEPIDWEQLHQAAPAG